MSLYDFVAKYDKVSGKINEGDDKYIKIKGSDGRYIRTLQPRNKEPVIYHNNYSLRDEPELFYYSMLALYKPWREERNIIGDSTTYREEYFKIVEKLPQLKEMSEKKIDIYNARRKMEEEADEKANNADDSEPVYIQEDDQVDLQQGMDDFDVINKSSCIKNPEQLEELISTLNNDQKRVYDKVSKAVEHLIEHDNGSCSKENCKNPLYLYVSGFGGTGKSYLIQALQSFVYIQKYGFGKPADIALTAPTGLAAANIGGQTLHSVFRLPVEHGHQPKYISMKSTFLQQTREVMKNLKLIIIDEISMVSSSMLLYINLRTQELFGADKLFGGKCVVLFGDLLQLPPVNGLAPFEELSSEAVHKLTGGLGMSMNLWRHFNFMELTINQRQAGSENAIWSDMLNRIRIGAHTQDDVNILQSRIIPLSPCETPREYVQQIVDCYLKLQEENPSTVCILPLRKMVESFNTSIMDQLFPDCQKVTSIDEVDGKSKLDIKKAEDAVSNLDKKRDSRNTADLDKSILLCKGVRIMLRKNIDTAKGLVNGSMGTVREIIRSNAQETKVEMLLVKFDGVEEAIYISRDTRKVKIFEGSFLHRSQFPVSLGYGMTIHKAQGLSLQTVLCDLGKSVFETGQIYVALSRCKSLKGLNLINLDPDKILVNSAALQEYIRLGSVPVRKDNTPKMHSKGKKSTGPNAERVWYKSDNMEKATSTIADLIKSSTSKGKPRAQIKIVATNKNNTKPRNIQVPLSQATISDHINKILGDIPSRINSAYISSIIDADDMRTIFRHVLIPGPKADTNSFLYEIATELKPDAFNNTCYEDKWVTGATILKYISLLKDNLEESGGPTLYNLGPYGRKIYLDSHAKSSRPTRSSSRLKSNYIMEMVNATFTQRRFTRLRLVIILKINTDILIYIFNFESNEDKYNIFLKYSLGKN